MKTPFSIAVWTVLVSVIVKMFVFVSNNQFTDIGRYSIFINIFLVMTAVFIGIREFKKKVGAKSGFLQDFKMGMRTAAWYALLLSIFVYCYYSFIDTEYFPTLLESRLELASESGVNVKQAQDTGMVVLSPFFQTTITLIGFMILGALYSALITFVVRRIKGFGH